MKHFIIVALVAALAPLVGINAQQPSAILNLESSDKGFLPPRMTTAERDAIPNPTAGMIIYNTSTLSLNVYNEIIFFAAWREIALTTSPEPQWTRLSPLPTVQLPLGLQVHLTRRIL